MQLVSICIPTYEGDKYLQEALDSVKKQTYKNIEVIISDDDSKDTTLSICEKFKKEVDFPVFIYNHQPQGIGANWNHCIKKANGEYIKFLFQDDILVKNCLENQIVLLQSYELKAICCKRILIDDFSNDISTGDWFEKYGDLQKNINFTNGSFNIFDKMRLKDIKDLTYNFFGEPDTFLYKKSLFAEVGFFREDLRQILDLEFSYRILKKYPIMIQNEKLLKFRLHQKQASSVNRNKNLEENNLLKELVIKNNLKYMSSVTKKAYFLEKFPLLAMINQLKNKILR